MRTVSRHSITIAALAGLVATAHPAHAIDLNPFSYVKARSKR